MFHHDSNLYKTERFTNMGFGDQKRIDDACYLYDYQLQCTPLDETQKIVGIIEKKKSFRSMFSDSLEVVDEKG